MDQVRSLSLPLQVQASGIMAQLAVVASRLLLRIWRSWIGATSGPGTYSIRPCGN
jgi:hypothetical protein